MTRTVVASASREAIIGFDQPFCVIGERINPTGRKKLAAEMEAGDFSTVEADALAQVAAGATMLDVNAGVTSVNPNETEPPLLAKTIELVQQLVDVPLCIDSSVPAALAAGLAVCKGRPLLNSVTGEEERLEEVLPLVKQYDVPVVAISNDETGISEDPDVRFEVARKIVERAQDFGIPPHDVVVDPLVMPIGAMGTAGQQVFQLVRRLRSELKGQYNLRRFEHFLRPAQPAWHQRGIPADGDCCRHDICHHEPSETAGDGSGPGSKCPDVDGRELPDLDLDISRTGRGWRGRFGTPRSSRRSAAAGLSGRR